MGEGRENDHKSGMSNNKCSISCERQEGTQEEQHEAPSIFDIEIFTFLPWLVWLAWLGVIPFTESLGHKHRLRA